jgi:Arc/MetJ-type ribon-helix-helix transcriptional regulator
MSSEDEPVSVSLPSTLADRLETLVEEDVFDSRAEALRYGARLVVREEADRVEALIDPDPPADDSLPGRAGGGSRSAPE